MVRYVRNVLLLVKLLVLILLDYPSLPLTSILLALIISCMHRFTITERCMQQPLESGIAEKQPLISLHLNQMEGKPIGMNEVLYQFIIENVEMVPNSHTK